MIDLKCVPENSTGSHQYLLDCTECGPLGLVDRVLVHTFAYTHMAFHGVDMPDEPTCDCGYNLLHPTGHPLDRAVCTRCTWEGAGEYADHQAHHHYLDTHHIWELQMGAKR